MKKIIITLGLLLVLFLVIFVYFKQPPQQPTEEQTPPEVVTETKGNQTYKDLITITSPLENAQVTSPLTIKGEARGTWYFEATFQIILVDWDGRILAEGFAQATEDWMTEDFVPFTAELTFDSPYQNNSPEFMGKGALILKKDNPSGLPEFDDAFEMPIKFTPKEI